MNSIIIFMIIAIGLLWPSTPADACSCFEPGPPVEELAKYDAVFTGTVIDRVQIELAASDGARPATIVTFALERSWKGSQRGRLVIMTGLGGGDCGYRFEKGERYLVYAFGKGDTLATSICSRTRSLSAAAADIRELDRVSGTSHLRLAFNTGITSIDNDTWHPGPNAGLGIEVLISPNISVSGNVSYHHLEYRNPANDSSSYFPRVEGRALNIISSSTAVRYTVPVAPEIAVYMLAGLGYSIYNAERGDVLLGSPTTGIDPYTEASFAIVGGIGTHYRIAPSIDLFADLPVVINFDAVTSRYIFPVEVGVSFTL